MPALVAHRAGNDLGRLRAAEAAGIGTVEADVQLVGREPVLRHPAVVGGRELGWEPWARAGRRGRLHLDELLELAAPDTALLLDLKGSDPRLATAVVARLDSSERQVVAVCGRTWALLEPFEDVRGVRVLRSAGSAAEVLALLRRETRGDGACVRAHLLDRRITRLLREQAEEVLAWTVNSPAEASALLELGVDRVISDDVRLLDRVALPQAA